MAISILTCNNPALKDLVAKHDDFAASLRTVMAKVFDPKPLVDTWDKEFRNWCDEGEAGYANGTPQRKALLKYLPTLIDKRNASSPLKWEFMRALVESEDLGELTATECAVVLEDPLNKKEPLYMFRFEGEAITKLNRVRGRLMAHRKDAKIFQDAVKEGKWDDKFYELVQIVCDQMDWMKFDERIWNPFRSTVPITRIDSFLASLCNWDYSEYAKYVTHIELKTEPFLLKGVFARLTEDSPLFELDSKCLTTQNNLPKAQTPLLVLEFERKKVCGFNEDDWKDEAHDVIIEALREKDERFQTRLGEPWRHYVSGETSAKTARGYSDFNIKALISWVNKQNIRSFLGEISKPAYDISRPNTLYNNVLALWDKDVSSGVRLQALLKNIPDRISTDDKDLDYVLASILFDSDTDKQVPMALVKAKNGRPSREWRFVRMDDPFTKPVGKLDSDNTLDRLKGRTPTRAIYSLEPTREHGGGH